MKSRTSLFNRTIIVNLLQRYWVAFAAYLIILGAVVVIPLINYLQASGWNAQNVPHYASLIRFMSNLTSVVALNFIAVAVAAALLYSFLYSPRHTGMMASLPIKRESMYLSVSAAAMGGMALCNVVVFALCLLVEVIYGQVHLGGIGMLLGLSLLTILAFYGLAAFCCMLTGNIFAGPAVYFIFNFVTVGFESLAAELLRPIVFGIPNNYSPLTMFLSPILQVASNLDFSYESINNDAGKWVDYTWKLEGVGTLLIYVLVGLVFLWLGMLLYKNRRMETAGDTISIEILKPVFRFCCTVGGGLLAAVFIQQLLYQVTPTRWMAAAYIAVLLIIGGVLGYFISKMLIDKTIRVFRTGWKTVGIYAACVIVLMACIETDVFGYERKVPHISDVEAVSVCTDGGYMDFYEEENIQAILNLHSDIILNKELHEMESGSAEAVAYLSRFNEPNAELLGKMVRIDYSLTDGSTVSRRYTIKYGPDEIRDPNSEIRALESLVNTEEGINERMVVDFPVTTDNASHLWVEYTDGTTFEGFHFSDFAPSDIARMYNECILPDIAEGKLGVLDIVEDLDYAKSKYQCTIGFELYEEQVVGEGGGYYTNYHSITVYPTLEASRTMAFLKEYGIEPPTVYEAAVADGYDYNDLGRYGDEPLLYGAYDSAAAMTTRPLEVYEESTEASVGIIGGADGPTAVYVTK